MKTLAITCALAFVLAFAAPESEAAKRFGGGGNLGKQRPAPTQNQAAPAQQPAPPAAAPAPVQPKPSFMGRWGGLLAGLGIGALLASVFGAELGPIVGLLLAGILAVAVVGLLFRLFRGAPAAQTAPASGGFSGIGSRVAAHDAPVAAPPPAFDKEPFLRVAKTSFIRLQAANDAGDLDDIRDYTTPEMYAEISMQMKDRAGKSQRTEVVDLHAELVESVVEGDYEIASVRFYGLIREDEARNPEPFDETWHVRKDRRDRRAPWLIAGIQQAA